jgi:hypothetical protein
MATFTILHCPLHAPSAVDHADRVTDGIQRHLPTVAAPTEAYGIVVALGRVPGYRLVLETGGRDRRRGQKDNPLLLQDALPSLGSGQVFGCPASTPLRIAPERWLTWATVELPGRPRPHCHVSLHPHAGVQGDLGGLATNDRGQKFRQQMGVLEQLLAFAAALGWTRSVSGDLNFADKGTSPHSPYRIMRSTGLTVESEGINAIGCEKALRMEVERVAAPEGVTDHPWLLATVT